MDSGSSSLADAVDCPKAQKIYDTVVANSGCSSATDALDCVRGLEYTTFLNAANSVPSLFTYSGVALSYLPRPDGVLLTDPTDILVAEGKFAKVPFIIGDQEDEGTLFSLFQTNFSTTDNVAEYISTYLFTDDPTAITDLVAIYPDDPSDVSPYRTLIFNQWYPQYKRMASLLGDCLFNLLHRNFLSTASSINPTVPTWSYLATYDFGTTYLGTFHGSDLLQLFSILDEDSPARAMF